jgi:hypothetical protein
VDILFAGAAGALPCLLFGGFAALVVGLIIWGVIRARQEREAMAALAAELGVRFYPEDPWDLPGRYGQFDLFDSGHSKHATNVLAGDVDGRSMVACDYSYKTGSGKEETTHSYQAVIVGLPILAPHLFLRDENFLDKMAAWVGHDDINFESAEFSRKYYVKCDALKFAYDIFHARLIEYLLACGNAPAMEMRGPLFVLHDNPRGPDGIRRMLQIGRQIVQSIPEYVLKERGQTQPPGVTP